MSRAKKREDDCRHMQPTAFYGWCYVDGWLTFVHRISRTLADSRFTSARQWCIVPCTTAACSGGWTTYSGATSSGWAEVLRAAATPRSRWHITIGARVGDAW